MELSPELVKKILSLLRTSTLPPDLDVQFLYAGFCPTCGQSPIICIYADLGSADFYDNYAHLCANSNCSFVLHHESFTGNVGGRPESTADATCWFCHRAVQMSF